MNDVSRGSALAADRRFYGVAEALVHDNNDPLQEGRVRLTLPWFSASMVTEWCRVVQPYAGCGYGAYFVPEIGDEVLIAFIHGDMRIPVVLGGLYNGKDKPPEARGGGSDPKYIRTRAGHRISFEDAEGRQKIEIVDASGANSVTIDTVANRVTMKAGGDIAVEATGKLTLKGTTGVEISGATIDLN
ncbi:MAG: phage baseplate assembly protein V [Hyphomicrobiaceae bacterium]